KRKGCRQYSENRNEGNCKQKQPEDGIHESFLLDHSLYGTVPEILPAGQYFLKEDGLVVPAAQLSS
ncbi:hypothetical protein, partial [Bacteroides fragilis]|uniref:hypothetical protein n=1 Tax=Bacteroides fragilis TaxID=817 RepID=UPI0024566354